MRIRLKNKIAQATTELAVMGTIILFVFAMFLRYCQIFDMKQWAQMYAFRTAIHKARERANSNEYAGASVVVMPEVYTVNPSGIERTPTFVSASGSVDFDIRMSNNIDHDGTPKRDQATWVPETYYQVGNRMINEHKALLMPLMKVRRTTGRYRVSSHDPAHLPIDSAAKLLVEGDENPKEFWSAEPVPVEKSIVRVKNNNNVQYKSEETPNDSHYQDNTEVEYNQTIEYVFKTPQQIYADSIEKNFETSMVRNPENVPKNMTIILEKNYNSKRELTTPK